MSGEFQGVMPPTTPLINAVMKFAPAIAAGNTFVHKPSEHTPIGLLRLTELFHEHTAIPEGVLNVVPGFGDEAGAALTEHDDVDMLTFTGGSETGRAVARRAGDNLNPVMTELGGKSPNIVFADADLENAAKGVVKGVFQASGEACTAGSRLLVQASIEDEVLDGVAKLVENVTIGDPMDEDTDIGPLAFGGHAETVTAYIERSEEEGLSVTQFGELPAGEAGEYAVRPTIVAGADNDNLIAQEEVFGPVLTIITFTEEAEAVELANDIDYGLAAGIWTEDLRRAHRVANRIRAGAVWVNEYRQATYTAPFGGMKDSGIGRQDGKEGLEEYLQSKTVWVDLSGEVPTPFTEHTIVQDD
jgi:aldehyde dehydrogenase (NAD+)